VHRWVRRFLRKGRPTDTGTLLMTLTHALKESFTYERRGQQGTREPALTLKLGRGSCRDLALLMIEAVRSLGIAARFVSGYLYVPFARRPDPCRRRLHARLGAGLSAGRRMGRVRSHQRHRRQPRPDPRRRGARPEPGHPAVRHLLGLRGRLHRHDG
jgi:hypothetical protein